MAKPKLQLVPPATKNGTVAKAQPPVRPKNEDLREREHLRPEEIERLIEAARGNRHGGRDALMVLIEVCLLRTSVRFLREERWASTRSWWFAKGHR